ncbi:hypothetical protein GOC60_17010 [Sinorhizobium meliloti]|nr:hypothetical protein [Sinorhizobium meliloti]MDX0350164.1 hypothetical protein [Sinorhizobium meliloti]
MADVSKFTGYAVIGPPDNHNIASKLTGYAVIGPPAGHNLVSKFVVYAVLGPEEATPEPPAGRRRRMQAII